MGAPARNKTKNVKSPNELIEALSTENPAVGDLKLLRKAVTCWLMHHTKKERHYPSREEYITMAKSIVHYFPNTANKHSPHNYDLFFDPVSGASPLECYARNKRSRDGLSKAQPSHHSKRIRLTNQEEFSPEEIEDAEKFMRRTPLTPETKQELMLKFETTRQARLAAIENKANSAGFIVKKYPLLVDTLEAVDFDFKSLQKTAVKDFVLNWQKIERNIIEEAKRPNLLVHLFPNCRAGKNDGVKKHEETMNSIIQLFPEDTVLSDVVEKASSKGMAGLGLCVIG